MGHKLRYRDTVVRIRDAGLDSRDAVETALERGADIGHCGHVPNPDRGFRVLAQRGIEPRDRRAGVHVCGRQRQSRGPEPYLLVVSVQGGQDNLRPGGGASAWLLGPQELAGGVEPG